MNEIFTRTSVRNFTEKMPSDDQIELLLKAAMQAPSAGNQRSWEVYVVRDRTTLTLLSSVGTYGGCTKDAPLAIVVCTRKSGLKFQPYARYDCACAAENLWLAAHHLGLGTTWLGVAPDIYAMERVREILDLPGHLEAFCIMPLGFPSRVTKAHSRFEPAKIHFVG